MNPCEAPASVRSKCLESQPEKFDFDSVSEILRRRTEVGHCVTEACLNESTKKPMLDRGSER